MQNYVPHLCQKLLITLSVTAQSDRSLLTSQRLNKSKSTVSQWNKELEIQLSYNLSHNIPNRSVPRNNQRSRRALSKNQSTDGFPT